MRAGELRHWVELWKPTKTTADSGDVIETYAQVATVPANVKPLTGAELMQARQMSAEVSHAISLRYYAGLGPGWKIVLGDRTLFATSVVNVDEGNREHQVMATEKV